MVGDHHVACGPSQLKHDTGITGWLLTCCRCSWMNGIDGITYKLGKFPSLGLFYKHFPRLGLFPKYFPGGAIFARTQHASRNWEWRLHAWLTRGERWRDAPVLLATSCMADTWRTVEGRANLVGDFSTGTPQCCWSFVPAV